MYHHAQFFYVDTEGLNPGPHACAADALPTEPSLQTQNFSCLEAYKGMPFLSPLKQKPECDLVLEPGISC